MPNENLILPNENLFLANKNLNLANKSFFLEQNLFAKYCYSLVFQLVIPMIPQSPSRPNNKQESHILKLEPWIEWHLKASSIANYVSIETRSYSSKKLQTMDILFQKYRSFSSNFKTQKQT